MRGFLKKISYVFLGVFLAIGSLLVGCANSTSSKNDNTPRERVPQKRILIVRNSSNDQYTINEQIIQGVDRVKKEIDNAYIEITPSFSQEEDVRSAVEDFLTLDGEAVLFTDPSHEELLVKFATDHPKVQFAILDIENMKVKATANIARFAFNPIEVGRLMGYAAAKLSKTKKIGFIGGVNDDYRATMFSGYQSGALSAKQSVRIESNFVGPTEEAFNLPELAFSIANRMYIKDVDMIAHDVKLSAQGILDAAVKNRKSVLGFAFDQSNLVGEYEKGIFNLSVIKRFDACVQFVVKKFMSDFEGGTYNFGVEHNALDYYFYEDNEEIKLIQPDLQEFINKLKQK